jgi:trk system potassium uptake protein
MRYKIVLCIIGSMMKVLSLLLLVPGVVAAIYRETDGVIAFALTSLLSLFAGMLLKRFGHGGDMGHKEAFAIVTLGWLCATFFGALPFIFQGISLVDALFESISGFSATGATILVESNAQGYYTINHTLADSSIASILAMEAITRLADSTLLQAEQAHTYYGLLFWRSFQQLVGGMGIILLIVAIFPRLRIAGRQLFMAEAIGPTKGTITPKAIDTARIL